MRLRALLRGAHPFELNYGERQGDPRFPSALADFLNAAACCGATPESLMLTGGISQALDYLCSRLTEPGDTVFVEGADYPVFPTRSSAITA
jgi:DNA-binding transcriptional MocR family regulator